MTQPSEKRPSDATVLSFLERHHGRPAEGLEVLSGGFWSAAYGYRVGDEELVLRISDSANGFRDDKRAMRYDAPGLPVPEVLHIGEGFDRWVAVSRRHHGRVLEQASTDEADVLGPTVANLLATLRSVPDPGDELPAGAVSWHRYLLDGLTDLPDRHTSGWRPKLAAHGAAGTTFTACDDRIRASLDACVDRRQLVHGDLLHANVLISPLADAVTAVFSWKCSTWGDALYDLAWCTFWGRWHPGIGALDLWNRVVPTLSERDREDVAARHHAYELHIGASHLGWYATLGDDQNLDWTVRQLDEILEAGPRSAPST